MILRINPPGQPVRFLDLGPARARVATGGSLGGPIDNSAPDAKYASVIAKRKYDAVKRGRK